MVIYVLGLGTSAETADKLACRDREVYLSVADTSVHCQFSAVFFGPFCPRVFKSIKKKLQREEIPLSCPLLLKLLFRYILIKTLGSVSVNIILNVIELQLSSVATIYRYS